MLSYRIVNKEWAIGKMVPVEVLELFTALESNQPQEVEDVKHKFHDQFNNSKLRYIIFM